MAAAEFMVLATALGGVRLSDGTDYETPENENAALVQLINDGEALLAKTMGHKDHGRKQLEWVVNTYRALSVLPG